MFPLVMLASTAPAPKIKTGTYSGSIKTAIKTAAAAQSRVTRRRSIQSN